jgi:hypothetical protein
MHLEHGWLENLDFVATASPSNLPCDLSFTPQGLPQGLPQGPHTPATLEAALFNRLTRGSTRPCFVEILSFPRAGSIRSQVGI